MEWSVMEWYGMACQYHIYTYTGICSVMECNVMEWNVMQWNGLEWSVMECNGV